MAKVLDVLKISVLSICKRSGLNQAELAAKIGIKPTQFSRQIGGKSDVRMSALEGMAKALDVPAFYLLMTEDERALWDAKANDPIEKRVESLERQISELASKSRTPPPLGHALPALEALAEEMQRVIGDPASKKHERKKGNG